MVSEKSVKTFFKEFGSDHQYKHLEDTFVSKCGMQCKIILKCTRINKIHYEEASGKRNIKKVFRSSLEEWEQKMILNVDSKYGKAKVHIYSCNEIFIDPSLYKNDLEFYTPYRKIDVYNSDKISLFQRKSQLFRRLQKAYILS